MARNVAVIVGSIRKESLTRKVVHAIVAAAPSALAFRGVEIADLGFYNQDLDATPPAPWVAFRNSVAAADAVLFATPEYNRSVPGVLKNAIDIGSRPYGASVFNGKPAAVVSTTPGALGGFGANNHLRQTLAFLNMPTLAQPEMYLHSVGGWFDETGAVKSPDTVAMLAKFGEAFSAWIEVQLRA